MPLFKKENNMTLFEKIDLFKTASDKVAELQATLDDAKANLAVIKLDLANSMTDEEITSISRGDFTYSVVAKTKYSKKSEETEKLIELLNNNGLGDLVQPSINATRLSSAMNELAEENGGTLPAEFGEVINTYSYLDISKRKKSK